MAAETQPAPSAPEFKTLRRLSSIPLVSDSLAAAHTTLSNSPFTATPYATATAASLSALDTANKYAQTPAIASRLGPIVATADGYAGAAVDAVEARFPYPFQASPEEVKAAVTARSTEARDAVNKTIDDRVYQPATRVATGIDQNLTPVVDYLEAYVKKFVPTTTGGEQYQYQRALTISRNLRDNLFALSAEQLRALQQQSVLVQRASETALQLAHGAQELVNRLIAELHNIRTTTQQLPSQVQSSLQQLTAELTSTVGELSGIVGNKELAAGDKVKQVRETVEKHVQPLLDATTARLKTSINSLTPSSAKQTAETTTAQAQATVQAVETDVAKAAEDARAAGTTYVRAAKSKAKPTGRA